MIAPDKFVQPLFRNYLQRNIILFAGVPDLFFQFATNTFLKQYLMDGFACLNGFQDRMPSVNNGFSAVLVVHVLGINVKRLPVPVNLVMENDNSKANLTIKIRAFQCAKVVDYSHTQRDEGIVVLTIAALPPSRSDFRLNRPI